MIPHIKFIETLVISKFSVDGLKEKLEDHDLPVPEKHIAVIYDTLRSEAPEYFDRKSPEPADPDWIREHDVVEGFEHFTKFSFPEDTPSLDGAIKLLNDPLMYRLITSMALALITEEDIELIVNGKYNMEYTSDDVKMFLKYFFNVKDYTLKDRQRYVKGIAEPQLRKYYKIALKGDKQHLLWKLGVTPDKNFSDMLRDIAQDSYYNFKEQSKVRPDIAQRWANLTIKVTDRINTIEEKEKDGSDFLEDFEFKVKTFESDNQPIKHLKEVKDDDKED